MTKLTAEIINHDMTVEVNVPSERFWIRDDYGRDAQVRLEPDGTVYLCYTVHDRRTIVSVSLPWDVFVLKFREFVDSET